ncbi:MAG: matrixin family metalloprotease [Myxococcales bacterium FL481]|nr:MAG: matrixin family metalloprotease [Myxococcales bacterium FL481]
MVASLLAAWLFVEAGPVAANPGFAATPARTAAATTVLDREAAPRCPQTVAHCFGLDVHVAATDGRPVATPDWLDGQVAEANRHFAAIGVGFEIASVTAIASHYAHVATRKQRDRIGHEPGRRKRQGLIRLFVVARLDDVDKPGEQIRGVHWRRRQNIKQRWIILSTIARPMVLAHELGHYFGLPHATHPKSIMNKRKRKHPPPHARTFTTPELAILRRERDAAVTSGHLVPRR